MNSQFTTADLAFAAFLCMRGYRLVAADREQSGRFRFCFDDPTGTAPGMHSQFLSSEFPIFDNFVKILKRRIYTTRGSALLPFLIYVEQFSPYIFIVRH